MSTPIPTRTAYIDTETGGLRPTDRPWEIAVVIENGPGTPMDRVKAEVERWVFHVSDFDPSQADPTALRLGGFFDRHPMHALDESVRGCLDSCFPGNSIGAAVGLDACTNTHGLTRLDDRAFTKHIVEHEGCVASRLARLLHDTYVVCCNPVYDMPRLEALLNRHSEVGSWHYRPHCATGAGAVVAGMHPATPNSVVGRALGVHREAHGAEHGALADALYARDLDFAAKKRMSALLTVEAAANA